MLYKAPEYGSRSFSCPHCGALAQQEWRVVEYEQDFVPGSGWKGETVKVARCFVCGRKTLWSGGLMVYPYHLNTPEHNPDMPEAAAKLYVEASLVAAFSPSSACALLRLAMMKLFGILRKDGYTLSEEKVFAGDLPEAVCEALKSVGVVGSGAVAPSEIRWGKDDSSTVAVLFDLINLITEYTISARKRVDNLALLLPRN